jgi:hypothetical protein
MRHANAAGGRCHPEAAGAMHEIVQLVGALAWPVTVLIVVFVLRPELLRLVGNLSRRVETATSLTIKASGIEIKGPVPVSPGLQQRKREFTSRLRGITDKTALDALADALNAAKSPDMRAQRASIIAAMSARVETDAAMDDLLGQLRELLPTEFGQ